MAKKFLDESGLSSLWSQIRSGYAPKWKVIAFDTMTINPVKDSTERIDVTIQSISESPKQDANGNWTVDTSKAFQKVLSIPTATQSLPGVMSTADKTKLDNMGSSIEDTIPLKGIQIGGNDLTIEQDSNGKSLKTVNFGLHYNAATDDLALIDLNNGNKVCSSVSILGDALKDAIISDAEIVDSDGTNSGTFLKITFVVTDQDGKNTTRDVYANVADLIDTYEAGTGITISKGDNTGVDGVASSKTITLKTATTSKIGGIKISKDTSDYTVAMTLSPTISKNITEGRYRAVEIDKNDKAFVYCPPENVSIGTGTTASETTTHQGTFTAITALDTSVDKTSGDITIAPKVTTYTLPTETTLSKGADSTATAQTLTFGGTFTAMVDTTVSNHTIIDSNRTFTMPTQTELSVSKQSDETMLSLDPGLDSSYYYAITGLSVANGHIIKPTYRKVWVQDPDSIPTATITALSYENS
jgi:hypothetical protein